MKDYDYLLLSPYEFENVSRDLVQKELSLTLESFKVGKDNGIDFRYSESNSANIILQAKRYRDFNSLMVTLKTEVEKVNKVHPSRYILTTSVGLSPANKAKIFELFKPFIIRISDIYGRDDLNNLLGKYPKIEQDYYKLWISSTDVLKRILHSSVVNQSIFDEEDIRDGIQKYVVNPSLTDAEKVLTEYRVVIISGIPGIGKTTLAKALCYRLIASRPKDIEFVSIGQNIREAYDVFEKTKAQIFFYDDFLGSNFLVSNLAKNEDANIVTLIEKIGKSENKYLICTTREYILQQAMQISEKIHKNTLLQVSRYVVDLAKYTKIIRANILYNHLYFSSLPYEYLSKVLYDRRYLKIIEHPNFNPRIIDLVTREFFYVKVSPSEYVNKIIAYLLNPEEIWMDAFENQITMLSQVILMVIAVSGESISYGDLFSATVEHCKSMNGSVSCNQHIFNKSIKELENSFISTHISKVNFGHEMTKISLQNPSIQDFLKNYIGSNHEYMKNILKSSVYIHQFFYIFSLYNERGKVTIPDDLTKLFFSELLSKYNSLRFLDYGNDTVYEPGSSSNVKSDKISKLEYVLQNMYLDYNLDVSDYFRRKFLEISFAEIDDDNIHKYVFSLSRLKSLLVNFDYSKLLNTCIRNIFTVSGLIDLLIIRKFAVKEFDEFRGSTETSSKVMSILHSELSEVFEAELSADELASLLDDVRTILNTYYISSEAEIDAIKSLIYDSEELLSDLEAREDEEYNHWIDEHGEDTALKSAQESSESETIDNLFGSLIA